MEKLSLILWQERELLETLLYRLEVEQLVMSTGQTRWLAHATRDVESVLSEIRSTEILRAVAADEAAEEAGLEPSPSLSDLVERSSEPWKHILAEHRDAFAALTAEITRLAEANRTLISAGVLAVRDVLLGLGGEPRTYAPDGSVVAATGTRSTLLDRSL